MVIYNSYNERLEIHENGIAESAAHNVRGAFNLHDCVIF